MGAIEGSRYDHISLYTCKYQIAVGAEKTYSLQIQKLSNESFLFYAGREVANSGTGCPRRKIVHFDRTGTQSKGDVASTNHILTQGLSKEVNVALWAFSFSGPFPGHLVSETLSQLLQPGPLLESGPEFRLIREQRSWQAARSQQNQDWQHICGSCALVWIRE